MAEARPIRFYLDGQLHEVDNTNPFTTVLDYLRDVLGRRGSKEGCAEGDCGACTVVVSEVHHGRLRYRAVNSCIQLVGSLDGKELLTVESLPHFKGGCVAFKGGNFWPPYNNIRCFRPSVVE